MEFPACNLNSIDLCHSFAFIRIIKSQHNFNYLNPHRSIFYRNHHRHRLCDRPGGCGRILIGTGSKVPSIKSLLRPQGLFDAAPSAWRKKSFARERTWLMRLFCPGEQTTIIVIPTHTYIQTHILNDTAPHPTHPHSTHRDPETLASCVSDISTLNSMCTCQTFPHGLRCTTHSQRACGHRVNERHERVVLNDDMMPTVLLLSISNTPFQLLLHVLLLGASRPQRRDDYA